jgi:hypothetical protein
MTKPLAPLGPMSRVPPWGTVGLGCHHCFLLEDCGGIYTGFDCMSRCCDDHASCTLPCPVSQKFVETLRDSGGLDSSGPWSVRQAPGLNLPPYVPVIKNGCGRQEDIELPFVALPTIEVARQRVDNGGMFETADQLRSFFHIGRSARVMLVSVAGDADLERYWERSLRESLPERLAALGIELITSPNFSFPLDVPRPVHLANRRRSLVCAEELSEAGISVIPHLNAVTQKDWDFWKDFLREHPHVTLVAKEFQTGGRNKSVARWHIDQLGRIQDALGRGIHLIAVAGRRHMSALGELSAFTIVDSVPFMRAVKRRRLAKGGLWKTNRTRAGEPIDLLLKTNIAVYSQIIREDAARLRQYPLAWGDDSFRKPPGPIGDGEVPAPEWTPPPEQLRIGYP